MGEVTRTSKEWMSYLYKNKKPLILKPDGWDKSNFDFSFSRELITQEEFERRLNASTISTTPKKGFK